LFLSGLLLIGSFNNLLCHTFLAGFLVSHYLILPTIFYHLQLQSVLAPRFLPVLSILACLHCLFFAARGAVTSLGLAALVLQIVLLIFVIHMRSVTTWQVATIAMSSALAIARIGYEYYKTPTEFRSGHAALGRIACTIIPIIIISAGILGLSVYRKVAYDERYLRGDQIVTRVFWHNIFSGLAFNPQLSERYRLKVDDLSIVRAVGRFMVDNGRAQEWESIGGISEGYSKLHWAAYDRIAGEALAKICRDQLRECVATILCYKPISLLRHLSWLYGLRDEIPDVTIFVSPELGNAMELQLGYLKTSLGKTGLGFSLWDPLAVLMILSFAAICHIQQDRVSQMDVVSLVMLAIGALIPTLIGYPSMHTIAEPAIVLPAILYCGLAFLLGRRFRWRAHVGGLIRWGAAVVSAIRFKVSR
jgi:hypothetical protein